MNYCYCDMCGEFCNESNPPFTTELGFLCECRVYCNTQPVISLYELKGVLEGYLVQKQIDMIEVVVED